VVGVTAPHTTDSWTFNAASQSYTVIGSAVTFSNAATLTNNANAGQAISIANDMTGTFLSQSGASTLTLSGTNSFTGTNLAGGTLVNNGSLTSTITSTASSTFTNNSTVTGTVTLANVGNTFNNNSPGTVSGLVISGGTANNSGTLNGGLNNGGVFSNSGTLNSGLTNSGTFGQTAGSTNGGTTNTGTVNASGGAINGAIDNNAGGTFNVGGTVTSNSTFNNSTATSRLLVNSGTYTVTGLVTNSGTNAGGAISVSAGATLTANGGITNNNNARIVNNGTATGVLNNGGVFTNNAAYNGNVTNGGTIANTATATWTGNVISNTPSVLGITNDGIWIGNVQANTGTISNNLTWTGTISNSAGGTFNNNAPGTVSGLVTNAGTGTNSGTLNGGLSNTAGTFGNTGTIAGVAVSGGTVTNSNIVSVGVNVSGTGTYTQTAGTTSGGLSSSATVNANGGAINGGIAANNGTFNVGGNVTTDNIFVTGGVAQLNVTGGNFTGITTLTNNSNNANGIVVAATRTLSAANIANNAGSSIQNSGTLTATTGPITNSGTINNLTAGSVLNGGLTNSGTFTQTAGTTSGGVGNTGTINANGGAINGAISNNAAGIFNVGGTVTSNNTFSNSTATSRLLVNSGTYTVTGLVTNSGTNAAGGILVAAGATLAANGGITNNAGATAVNNGTTTGAFTMTGGTLSGIGNTQNLTVNGGTFAPGNGTAGSSMTVTGSLVLQAAATYLVQINPATASFTTVTGAATLGGTVNATYANGSYVAKRYTIVTAAAGLGGTTFASVTNTNLPGGFHSSLGYDANNAYLDLTLNFTPTSTPNFGGGLSGNQQAVGNALINFFNSTGGIPLVFGTLTPAGLTQISGETGTGSQQTTFNAMNQFIGVMTDPFIAGRGDPISGGGNPNAYADEATLAYAAGGKSRSTSERDAYAAIYRKAPIVPSFEQRWSVWAAGFGGSQTTDGNTVAGSNSTRSSIYGVAAGADYRLSPNTLAGFALAGGGTNFSVNEFGTGRSDLFQAGAFIRHTIGAAYLSGALAYGWQDVTTDRTVTVAGIDRLRAQFNANAWSGRVEGGYRFVSQGLGWTPYAAGQFTTFELPNYSEQAIVGSNIFALAYNSRSVTDTRSELGLRTDKSFAMPNGIFTLRGRAAWAHDFNPDRAIGATFQTLPGASFVVNGARQAADAALVTGSAEMKWINGWSTAATFEGEFSNVTRSYAGKGVVRYAW
jgi:uncharacterized protein with beta-barrel porin domain